MKLNKMSLASGMLITTLLFTACQQTPSTMVINNDQFESTTDATMEEIDIDKLPNIDIEYIEVNETIEHEEVQFTIDGLVAVPSSLKGLCTYYCFFKDNEEYEDDMEFLFGEYIDKVEGNLGQKYVSIMDEERGSEYTAHLATHKLSSPNYVFYDSGYDPVSAEKIPVDITMEEAIDISNNVIEQIGIQGFTLNSVRYLDEEPMEGYRASGDYYSLNYEIYLQGIPVGGTVYPFISVIIEKHGVSGVSIRDMEYEVAYELSDCISYEDAKQRLIEYVKGRPEYYGVVFDEVLFEYNAESNFEAPKYNYLATPYWMFMASNDGPPHVLVDAITGNIKTVNNAYVGYYGTMHTLYKKGLSIE